MASASLTAVSKRDGCSADSTDAFEGRPRWGGDGPGKNFVYQAKITTMNGKRVFIVHGEGQSPMSKGISCTLSSEPPGAEIACSGL